ncbi:hypothetical protein [Cetobacterium sp. ZWU0022]|uniref:hypothetical protein n=1 Tax=Cetobacterium sp. ZWU0022 TaxID=1340502 RepID=UPI000648A60A|nr:hypothetical protein [Cetobacterium sp. ZWU0022]
MKKIIIFLILLSIEIFGAIGTSTTKLYERREIVGGRTQNLVITTSRVSLTGLGGINKLSYDFGRLSGDNFKNKQTGYLTESLRIKSLEINSLMGRVDKERKEITGFAGNLDLVVVAIVEVRSDQSLAGLYQSPNLTLNIVGDKNNHDEKIKIDIDLEINVLKSLKVKTSAMDLGVGIQGQKMSSSNGAHGVLEIEGEPNKNLVISYSREVDIKNRSGQGVLKVSITTPNLENIKENDYSGRINANGRSEVSFHGSINDTKDSPPGEYTGELIIKVRYD